MLALIERRLYCCWWEEKRIIVLGKYCCWWEEKLDYIVWIIVGGIKDYSLLNMGELRIMEEMEKIIIEKL